MTEQTELLGKYPRYDADYADLERCITQFILPGFIPATPPLLRSDHIRTQGSCFARNIAGVLQEAGLFVSYFEVKEAINTPSQNAKLFKRIFEEKGSAYEAVSKDAALILTLGVGVDGYAVCLEAMRFVLATLRAINPTIRIILTVSPVPLNRSVHPSTMVTDCISKSTLRLVAHELMKNGDERVHYWPSFEIVRWLGGHIAPVYGADDGIHRHVNNALVALITKLFIQYYVMPDAAQATLDR